MELRALPSLTLRPTPTGAGCRSYNYIHFVQGALHGLYSPLKMAIFCRDVEGGQTGR